MKLTVGSMIGGVALLGAALFCHGTKTKSQRTPVVESKEIADTSTSNHREVAALLRSAAPPVVMLPEVDAPSRALPASAALATVPDPPQVDVSTEEHPGRTRELEQTPAWKGEKTRAILQVVSGRVERMEKEAAELERAGDVQGAASKLVLLTRLKRQISTMNAEIVAYSQADTAERR